MKKILSLLVLAILVMGLAVQANADGSVTYDGYANKFIFAPGTKDSPTSLFANFQNVLPGDTFTEQIVIKNNIAYNIDINVYMRSKGAQEGTEDFLSQMNLTVKQKKGDKVLFDASADKTAQLTDWVYLGTFYSGAESVLDVTLEVPITMGNEYQDKVGYIDWEFKVEEVPADLTDPDPDPPGGGGGGGGGGEIPVQPSKPSETEPPKTGDTSNLLLYSALMAFSFIALILLFVGKRKKNR